MKEFGRIPMQQKMIDRGLFSLNTYVTMFDSWEKISEITEYVIINQKKPWNINQIIKNDLEFLKNKS